VLRVMIKRTLRSTVTINKVTQKAPLTMDPLRTHVRTAASPTAKSLRTHRNNSQRDASDAVWVCGSGRTGRLRCVVLGEQDNQCVRFWENRKTKVCGSRKTGQPRCVALGEKDNQGVWVWENRTTKVRGSGRTGKQRCVVPGEQDNQGVWLWENRRTKVCGSGRTGEPRCEALGEQDNQGVWLWKNRTTKVCGSGRTGQPRCVALGEQDNQGVWLWENRTTKTVVSISFSFPLDPSHTHLRCLLKSLVPPFSTPSIHLFIYLFPPLHPQFSFLLSVSQSNLPAAHHISSATVLLYRTSITTPGRFVLTLR